MGQDITTPQDAHASGRRFRIALSFSGNERSYVEEVADQLAIHFGKTAVFYDQYFRPELARVNLDIYLQRIYQEDSDLVALFFSESYNAKMWCGLEWRAIRNLITNRPDHIIPIRMSSSDFPEGLFPVDGYLPADRLKPSEIAGDIIARYAQEFGKSSPLSRDLVKKRRPARIAISRRRFLLGIGAAAGISALYFGSMGIYRIVVFRSTVSTALVKNAKSDVIHHKTACKDHLPKMIESIDSSLPSMADKVHKGKLVYIAEIEARESYGAETEKLLIEAIKASPTSTHLYRFLVGIWGKNKKYDKIHSFLSDNIKYLEGKASQYQEKPKILKKYTNALADLRVRKVRADYLADMAKFTNA